MAKCISFGEINKSLLYIFLMSVSLVINQYLYGFTYIQCFYPMNIYRTFYNLIIKESDENDLKFSKHRIFDPLFSYAGVIILSFFFIKKKTSNELKDTHSPDERAQSKSEIILIFNKKKIYFFETKGILFYMLIIFLWIVEENLILIYVDIFQDLDFWFFELIFVSVIFAKAFVFKISSHQILGMAISILIGSALKIYNISITFASERTNKKTYYVKYPPVIAFSIFYFLLIILRSYVNTQIKCFLDFKYISQRFLMISYGIAGTIICILVGIITTNVTCHKIFNENVVCKFQENGKIYYDNWYTYYESGKNMGVRLIIIVLGFISYFVHKYYLTLIIKTYTPIHVIFSFPIQFFIEKIFLLIFTAIVDSKRLSDISTKIKKLLLDVSGDIGSIIGFLIYLEIIELNFCGLNFNLKKNIIKRSESDYIESLASKMVPLQFTFDDDSDDDEDSTNVNCKDNNSKDINSTDNNSKYDDISEENVINNA